MQTGSNNPELVALVVLVTLVVLVALVVLVTLVVLIVVVVAFVQCLKITEKVSFNIASEASYVYIFSGQKFIKNAQNGQFGEFLKT